MYIVSPVAIARIYPGNPCLMKRLPLSKFRIFLRCWYFAIPALLAMVTLLTFTGSVEAKKATAESEQAKKANLKKKHQIEQKRQEVKKKIAEARKKEKIAYWQLHKTKKELNSTKHQLKKSEHILKKTDRQIDDAATNLKVTEIWTNKQEKEAGKRLREIYEGHRLSFLEMIFQSDSLQTIIDRMYFQARIAEQDKGLLEKLRFQAEALAANRNRLSQKRDQLGSLLTDIKKRAEEIAKQKGSQEKIAQKLRAQRAFYERTERQLEQQSKALESQILDMESEVDNSSGEVTKGSGRFAMPLNAKLTSPFGWRRHPIFRTRKFHTGIDLAGPRRSKIRASDSGHVIKSGWYGGYGKVVIVSHGNGYSTLYAHLTKAMVKKGDNVKKGDVIGLEGSTGFATGPHLHFEVRVKGKPKNPLNYVK